ncbi:MAG: hypothetical protein SV487_03820 [Thermodesulfobacteriota bacterium]|nr:hypothetical protein [Thermodesulfobacteriota bacterium]
MKKHVVIKVWIVAVVCALFFSTAPVWASPIYYNLTGVSFPAYISADVSMNYDPLAAALTVSVTNTSSADQSSITAFAFNVPGNIQGISDFSMTPNPGVEDYWSDLYNLDDINTPGQFGWFDVAGITKNKFISGFVEKGIFQGATFIFTFIFAGDGLDSLATSDFDIPSYETNENDDLQPVIVRFQGIGPDDDSDVAIPGGAPPTSTNVPLPGAFWLLGSGLLGLIGLGRKRFS